jgi:hypothetical protein
MSERRRRSDFAVALFVTIFWAAVVFAVDGIIAIVVDRDPIEADVGPYYAIVALLLASIVTWLSVATVLASDSPWLSAFTATALVYLVLVATAAPISLGLVAQQAGSPFVIAAALLSGLTVVVAWSVLRRWWPNQPH